MKSAETETKRPKAANSKQPLTGVIIVAGGRGRRMDSDALPKQFRMLGPLPVLGHAIRAFNEALGCGAPIVVVLPEGQVEFWRNLAARLPIPRHVCVVGGSERFHSVQAGLAALPDRVGLVAVHDGARPLVSAELIRRAVACAGEHGSAIPVVEAVDSVRLTEGGENPMGAVTIDRRRVRLVQTPQVFDAWRLREAYRTEWREAFTDDASVVEHTGGEVLTLCTGERRNLKITTAEDLTIARALLENEALDR